ncbi:MAG: BamA/TamA family outer membrane protein, partial [Gemmatimonadales bacterium]
RKHFAVVHGAIGVQRNPFPGQEFDLGLGLGPRAARAHAFSGDRAFFTTAEYRYSVADEVLRLTGLGVAAFVDYGGAWYAGSPRRTGVHAGIGLRLASSRSPGVEALRIDVARRFRGPGEPGSWALVIGKGFPFTGNGRLDY